MRTSEKAARFSQLFGSDKLTPISMGGATGFINQWPADSTDIIDVGRAVCALIG